ncbi:hypothetical protein SAMN02982917_3047 [Azospirillum oryzae]|uniref:Double-GTPase 2 domain-containing protein n=1 Tax=Azospirillum oryzae TaxID=286727 RepID=A0A1X7FMK0_9PROT|nr:hypothetical protein [Azospirillum oryzae]SMF55149.1 hypothetical protein SAMN02982917_3047 [Azospirillum oryzae]
MPSPAVKSYFFGKGYKDLRDTIAEAWQRTLLSSRDSFRRCGEAAEDEWPQKLLLAFWLASGLSIFVFGLAVTAVLSLIHILILGVVFLVIYLAFMVVRGMEQAVLLVRRFIFVCPSCHARLPLPVYLCDGCGAAHPRLIPSEFGIMRHRCRCGRPLPATVLLNRGRLKSKCPECGALLAREHMEAKKHFIPIVGGPSVGKSVYMFELCRKMRETVSLGPSMTWRFLDANTERLYNQVISRMDSGQPPDKTSAVLPRAFDLLLEGAGQRQALYLYDPAGEAFLDAANLTAHKFLGYPSGIVFIIDPFSLQAVREQYRTQLAGTPGLRPSTASIEDTLTRLINVLEAQFGLGARDRVKAPIAVVINKVDAFDLDTQIGEAAVQKAAAQPDESVEQRRNRVIRASLIKWGQANFVQRVEGRFTTVAYFSVSALGRSPDRMTRAFEPRNVLDPALWILRHCDQSWQRAASGRP